MIYSNISAGNNEIYKKYKLYINIFNKNIKYY